jgi:NADPH:quinone reductase-like Zn-dependent oxidoreductase
MPFTPGSEAAGGVLEVGSEVIAYGPGNPVVPSGWGGTNIDLESPHQASLPTDS